MDKVKQVLSFLELHRAKVVSVLGTVISFLTVTQQYLSATDKATFVGAIAALGVFYLKGNSAYETVQAQVEATKPQ